MHASRRSFLAVAALAAAAPAVAVGRLRQTSVRSGSLGTLLRTVPLAGTLDHPQGISASADSHAVFALPRL